MKIYHDIEKQLLFESWKRRKFTLIGKSCTVNSLVISKLTYAATILIFPINDYIKKIQLLYTILFGIKQRSSNVIL